MATSKDEIKYGAAQAKVSEDEAVRIRYKAGTPIEGGKIADSKPVDLFSSAHHIARHDDDAENQGKIIAESDKVDVFSSAQNIDQQKQHGTHLMHDDNQG